MDEVTIVLTGKTGIKEELKTTDIPSAEVGGCITEIDKNFRISPEASYTDDTRGKANICLQQEVVIVNNWMEAVVTFKSFWAKLGTQKILYDVPGNN